MIHVGVIRGGVSDGYEASIETGANILAYLRGDKMKDNYKPVDIFIDRDGLWHLSGIPTSMDRIANSVDVVFNALHDDFSRDGTLQEILDRHNIAYVGSDAQASEQSFNHALSKERFDALGIKTTKHILFPAYQADFDGPIESYALSKAKKVWQTFGPVWIAKPLTKNSSMGIHVCKTFPELVRAIEIGAMQSVSIIVEEMIEGKKATVAVIEKFRGQDLYTLPAVEMRDTDEIVPGNFSSEEKRQLEDLALRIHTGLGLSEYSHTQFVVHPKKGIFAVEVTTTPEITYNSFVPKALSSVGATMPEFLHHIISRAHEAKNSGQE